MKHTRAAENYGNSSHKDVFTKFNRATNLNWILIAILILKFETSSAANNLT
jgi:hypothetical protein